LQAQAAYLAAAAAAGADGVPEEPHLVVGEDSMGVVMGMEEDLEFSALSTAAAAALGGGLSAELEGAEALEGPGDDDDIAEAEEQGVVLQPGSDYQAQGPSQLQLETSDSQVPTVDAQHDKLHQGGPSEVVVGVEEEEEDAGAPAVTDDLPFASEMMEEDGQESGAMADQGEEGGGGVLPGQASPLTLLL
jgi:hypothetical protein